MIRPNDDYYNAIIPRIIFLKVYKFIINVNVDIVTFQESDNDSTRHKYKTIMHDR